MGWAQGRRRPQAPAGSAAGGAAPGATRAQVQRPRARHLARTGRTAVAARGGGIRAGSRGDPGGELGGVSGGAFFGAVGSRAPDGGGLGQAGAGPGGPGAGCAAGARDQPGASASGIRLGGPVSRPGAADAAGGPARPGLRDHEFSKTPTLGPLPDRFLLVGVVVRRVPVAHADHARAVTGLPAADLARGGGLAQAWIGGGMGEAGAWAGGMSVRPWFRGSFRRRSMPSPASTPARPRAPSLGRGGHRAAAVEAGAGERLQPGGQTGRRGDQSLRVHGQDVHGPFLIR
jgi:hypothetical protein